MDGGAGSSISARASGKVEAALLCFSMASWSLARSRSDEVLKLLPCKYYHRCADSGFLMVTVTVFEPEGQSQAEEDFEDRRPQASRRGQPHWLLCLHWPFSRP